MTLTTEQKEYLNPVMGMYKDFLVSGAGNFDHFDRVIEVFKQNNEPIKPCMSCPDDKLFYIKYLYNLWVTE